MGEVHHRRVVASLTRHPLPGNLRDLFRVAYRIVAARCDPHAPLGPGDAVDYGLAALEAAGPAGGEDQDVSRAVARAFASSRPLDMIVADAGRLPTRTVERHLRRFMGEELRRIAKGAGVSADSLSDVSGRTLQSWVGEKESSGGRIVSSEISEE